MIKNVLENARFKGNMLDFIFEKYIPKKQQRRIIVLNNCAVSKS